MSNEQKLLNHFNAAAAELRAKNHERLTWIWPDGARNASWNPGSLPVEEGVEIALNWGDSTAGVLASNRVVVGAYHYKMDDSHQFMNAKGQRRWGFIEKYSPEIVGHDAAGRTIKSDIQLGLLDRTIHTTVPPHRVAGALPEYQPLTTLVTDKEGKAFWAVGEVRNGAYFYDKNLMEERLEGGDSGNPTFCVYKEGGQYKLALLGVHWTSAHESCLCEQPFREAIIKQCEKWGTFPPQFLDSVEDFVEDDDTDVSDEQRNKIIDGYLASIGLRRVQ